MKYLIICMFVLCVSIPAATAQPTVKTTENLKKELLEQSRIYRNAGWILFGLGTTTMVTSTIILIGATSNDTEYDAAGWFLLGTTCSLSSVPFFVISGSKARKAAMLSGGIKIEKVSPVLARARTIPAVGIRVDF